jgi:hypothetical protein
MKFLRFCIVAMVPRSSCYAQSKFGKGWRWTSKPAGRDRCSDVCGGASGQDISYLTSACREKRVRQALGRGYDRFAWRSDRTDSQIILQVLGSCKLKGVDKEDSCHAWSDDIAQGFVNFQISPDMPSRSIGLLTYACGAIGYAENCIQSPSNCAKFAFRNITWDLRGVKHLQGHG